MEGEATPDSEKEPSVSSQIQSLLDSDQQDRKLMSGEEFDKKSTEEQKQILSEIQERDTQRLEAAKQILKEKSVEKDIDLHNLSILFQHGRTEEDLTTAQNLSLKAIEAGLPPQVSLYPESTDRLILTQQENRGVPLRQKFGTQSINDFIPPVDGTATEEELEKYKPQQAISSEK